MQINKSQILTIRVFFLFSLERLETFFVQNKRKRTGGPHKATPHKAPLGGNVIMRSVRHHLHM